MNKIDKEVKNIIILLIIFLLLLGVYLICLLLKPDKEEESKIEVDGDYKIVNQFNHFKLYELNEEILNGFNTYINDINIKYINKELSINDNYILSDVSIVNKIGSYDDLLVMLLNNNTKSYILIYDKLNNNPVLFDQVDGLKIYDLDNVDLSEAGFNVYLTNVFNNNIIVDNSSYNMCEYKDTNIIVNKHIFYSYNIEEGIFNDYDLLSKQTLKEYKKDIC